MNISKRDIAKNISSNTMISVTESKLLLDAFINIIKIKSKISSLKIASFGRFSIEKTPQRIGRNPKTKQEFIISERSKLKFSASNKLRNLIN
jgi:integration host factor subunit alpha